MEAKCEKTTTLIWAAWLVYLVAWFLPVVQEGVTFPHGLPGWQALRVAACALWPCRDISIDKWYQAVFFTISGVTTLLFVPGSVWAVWSGSRSQHRGSLTAFSANQIEQTQSHQQK